MLRKRREGLTVNSELVLRQTKAMWCALLDSKATVRSTVFHLNVLFNGYVIVQITECNM